MTPYLTMPMGRHGKNRGCELPTAVHAATSPHRHLRISMPRYEVLDLRGSRPGGRTFFSPNQQHPRTPPTNTQATAPARTHRTLGLTIIAHDPCCCARNAACAAPAPLGPPYTTARTQCFSLLCKTSHAVAAARRGLAACMASFWRPSFLVQGSHPFPGRPFFLFTCIALRRAPRRPYALTFC